MSEFMDRSRARHLIEACLRRELAPDAVLPGENVDLVEEGVLDSMGWVSFLRAVESATGVTDLGSQLADKPQSIASILAALIRHQQPSAAKLGGATDRLAAHRATTAFLIGSGLILGSRNIPSGEVDREFGMPIGKLRKRAGIVSIARAAANETELTLAAQAATQALSAAARSPRDLDWIFATSETHQAYPSLGAQLHSRLLVRESCGVLDIGGACLGLLHALATAQAFLSAGQARTILVVTADVHCRIFTPGRVPGEFGGLFGDGASAFLMHAQNPAGASAYRLGNFHFGCAGQYAAAIRVAQAASGALDLQFDGEALSRAAVSRLEKILTEVALRSGFSVADAGAFATHQPNPRLVALLARQLGVSEEKFPPIAKTSGNLGSSTCAAALHQALMQQAERPATERKPIFLASLGPGLLFGGGWVEPASGAQ